MYGLTHRRRPLFPLFAESTVMLRFLASSIVRSPLQIYTLAAAPVRHTIGLSFGTGRGTLPDRSCVLLAVFRDGPSQTCADLVHRSGTQPMDVERLRFTRCLQRVVRLLSIRQEVRPGARHLRPTTPKSVCPSPTGREGRLLVWPID